MKLILLGAPGAGKGTQGEVISRAYGIPTISTGNILRAAIRNQTEVGRIAKACIEDGNLVPDQVIIQVLAERLAAPDCKNGYILDGVPRTIAQAEALEAAGIHFDCVLSIEVEDHTIEDRMGGRRVCIDCGASYHVVARRPRLDGICDNCGGLLSRRKDDAPETVRARIGIYHAETEPLKGFYSQRGILKCVDDIANIAEMSVAVLNALKA